MADRHLLNEKQMDKAIMQVAKTIVKDHIENVALVGIKTRGVPLADWLARKIELIQNKPIPVGCLDINLYRDDLSEVGDHPNVKPVQLPFSVEGKGIILVDDVLYTGRTIRSAMDAIVDHGRPAFVKLMVMVDRGWRELPIQCDYCAKSVKTTKTQNVKVRFQETDGINEVIIKG
jgi:pyrimidine operon attenuation protein/uracil phosphoribosyltransferase